MFTKLLNIFKKSQNYGSAQALGKKEVQEDSFYISTEISKKRLVLVADGVGGHGNGDFASQTVIELFKENWVQQAPTLAETNITEFLRKTAILSAAHLLNEIAAKPEKKNCGSTLTGFVLFNNKLYTINIGDSRTYKYSNGNLEQLSKDHSEIQRLIDTGILTEEEAQTHPRRTIITSAIGQPLEMVAIDINGPINCLKDDILLALSDGVFDTINKNEILKVIQQNTKSDKLAEKIVEAAINANATDNVTACYLIVK